MNEYLSTLLRYRPAAGWWDLLDIAIVSILIYEFLKLIRGTRAVQMAVGSLLIVGLFYVSRLAPLQTLNWMIRNALLYVAFAAIVIFQSDIRRALAHFGRAPFFRYFNRQEATNETIEEVVVAATMLASHRTGAIIAIEREIGLRNYIESGIPLDAEMTYDLLVTIFQPTSPLHDGAVVLQENRVAAAACFLPLTVNPIVSRDLGTRHRAAIGLTEENDAVAVVVSEETRADRAGDRRPARARPHRRQAARTPADAHLASADGQAPAGDAGLRALMAYHPFRHLGLKVLAIMLASVLWFTVAGEHVVERSLHAPLAVRNLPPNLEIVGELPESVDIRVRGSAAQLSRIDTGDVVAMLDLDDGANRPPFVPPALRRSPRAVRHRCRPGDAADDLAVAREVGASYGPDRAGDRRRCRGRVRRGTDFGRAVDRAGRGSRKPRAQRRVGDDRTRRH